VSSFPVDDGQEQNDKTVWSGEGEKEREGKGREGEERERKGRGEEGWRLEAGCYCR
jgi:hypothetical protein